MYFIPDKTFTDCGDICENEIVNFPQLQDLVEAISSTS